MTWILNCIGIVNSYLCWTKGGGEGGTVYTTRFGIDSGHLWECVERMWRTEAETEKLSSSQQVVPDQWMSFYSVPLGFLVWRTDFNRPRSRSIEVDTRRRFEQMNSLRPNEFSFRQRCSKKISADSQRFLMTRDALHVHTKSSATKNVKYRMELTFQKTKLSMPRHERSRFTGVSKTDRSGLMIMHHTIRKESNFYDWRRR